MTFRQMRLSLQLIAEERVGAPRYHAAMAAKEAEDRKWADATKEPDGVR